MNLLISCGRRVIIGAIVAAIATAPASAWAQLSRVTTTATSGIASQPGGQPRETYVDTMPATGDSGLELAGVSSNNLGTFDIVINPSVALANNSAALAAFNRAAQQWEAFISDPITVTIDADFSALGPGILGQAGSTILQGGYTGIRNQLVADAGNEPDDAIVASMPTAGQFSAIIPAGFGLNGNLQGTKANFKAMGFTGLDAPAFGGPTDAAIAFSTLFSFDFDRSNGITPGQFDFEGVAAHEIGHALGFISSVDDIDDILPGTSPNIQPAILDLFRFQDGSANDPNSALTFTTAARYLVPANDNANPSLAAVFDQIDASFGGSAEVRFSMGADFGDGQQASHWKDSLGLGIMDPTLAAGELALIRPNDLRSLDLIGYEIVVPIPEAGAWLFGCLLACAATAGQALRRRAAPRNAS